MNLIKKMVREKIIIRKDSNQKGAYTRIDQSEENRSQEK
jgi:hypothetical protein